MKLTVPLTIASFLLLIGMIVYQITALSKALDNRTPVPKSDGVSFTGLSDQMVSFSDFKGTPLVIMYYDPSCESCITIMTKIIKYASEFESVNLLLVTEAEKSEAVKFQKKFDLQNHANITLAFDRKEWLYQKYQLIETPSFVVFDAELSEVKVIDELVEFPIIIKYVREVTKSKS